MRYYAVPHKKIATIDQSSNPYRGHIFGNTKVIRIDMPQIIEAFNKSQSILLFDNEEDASAHIESLSKYDYYGGYPQFLSPPLLQVEYEPHTKAAYNRISVKPSETTLVSGKMLFIGEKKVCDLPYRPTSDNTLFAAKDTLFTSEFDLRMALIVFSIAAAAGWVADSYTINHEKTGAAVIAGAIAVILYSKWCHSRGAPNEERDTNDEIQRLSYKKC